MFIAQSQYIVVYVSHLNISNNKVQPTETQTKTRRCVSCMSRFDPHHILSQILVLLDESVDAECIRSIKSLQYKLQYTAPECIGHVFWGAYPFTKGLSDIFTEELRQQHPEIDQLNSLYMQAIEDFMSTYR